MVSNSAVRQVNSLALPTGLDKMRIAWESALLAAICAIDLASTMWLISRGAATESNPILAFYLTRGGAVSFAAVKLLLFLGPLFLLELFRCQRPQFVRSLLRVCIVAYVTIYVCGVAAVNNPASAFARTLTPSSTGSPR